MINSHDLSFLLIAVALSGCCGKSPEPESFIVVPPTAYDYSWFQYPEGLRVFKNQAGVYDTLNAQITDTLKDTKPTWAKDRYNDCHTFKQQSALTGSVKMKFYSTWLQFARL